MFRSNHSSLISKASHEDTSLFFFVLKEHFESHFNKARIKLISMFFFFFLVIVQTVNFNRFSNSVDSIFKSDSSLLRIQRFLLLHFLILMLIKEYLRNLFDYLNT